MPYLTALKYLIDSFYNSIANNTPLPLSYREILLTSIIMDEILSRLRFTGKTNSVKMSWGQYS